MQAYRTLVTRTVGALVMAGAALVGTGTVSAQLPLQVIREAGESVTPAYEGWYRLPDGRRVLLIGYFNRNTKQILDIPIGPNNRVEPGGPDMGQPTHFNQRRGWGVFTIVVPADFKDKYTWTIVANGKTESIPMGLHTDYEVEPFKDAAMGNTPPLLKFEMGGKTFTGPPIGIARELTATVGQPLALDVWVSDDNHKEPGSLRPATAPPATFQWHKHRGPGDVKFAEQRPKIDFDADGKTSTTATFSAPGEYVLRAQSNDATGEGGGGFQCCWTNAHVKVTVK
ncbi:MAG: hypothetical protein AB7Q16_01375 [Vicinamibacterales bacterium]